MNIHEAIMARTHEKPYITRRDWGYITVNPVAVSIKILPTNSPDGCVVESVSAEGPRSGWQPTAGDLAAEDWETVPALDSYFAPIWPESVIESAKTVIEPLKTVCPTAGVRPFYYFWFEEMQEG